MTTISFTTWNILAPIFVECRFYKSTECALLNIEKRRPKIFETIDSIDSDVFVLQEVTRPEFAELVKRYKDKYIMKLIIHDDIHWEMKDNNIKNGNAVFLRKSICKLEKMYGVLLSENGNRGLVCRFTIRGKQMAVCAVHLDHRSGLRRKEQIRALLHFLGKNIHMPLLIGGDFNEPANTIITYMKEKGFEMNEIAPTYFEEASMSIDHVFAKSCMISNTTIPKSNKFKIIQQVGSDHLPVTCSVSLR